MEFTLDNFEQLQEDLLEEQERCRTQRRVLERAVDRLAVIGIISNTPHGKHLIISGQREI